MKDTISKKYIKDYIEKELGYELRHDLEAMTKAIRTTAKRFKVGRKNLFHYIIERTNTIPMTTSYGFDTAYGREIREVFEYNYYNNK